MKKMTRKKDKKVLLIGINKEIYAIERVERELNLRGVENDFVKINSFVLESGFVKNEKGQKFDASKYGAVYFRSPSYEVTDKKTGGKKSFEFFEDLNLLIGFFHKKGIGVFNGKEYLRYPYYDKLLQSFIFQKLSIPAIKTLHAIDNKVERIEKLLKIHKIGYPVVIKESNAGMGTGVFRARNIRELRAILKNKRTESLIYQPFIKNEGDFRVLICSGKSLGVIKRKATKGNWKNNFSQGAEPKAFKDKKMEQFSEKMCEKMKIKDYAGVDLFKTKNGFVVIEVNMFPGFEGFEQAHSDFNVAEKIAISLEKLL